ncbi:cell wall metabolism sensor histidine kinase WalK [Paenibacillus sp. YYML68]|uniref:sensor histidine kinase n=1 Tax=Paenibacillus sp. YYML68 TaxID=2909250 RepID=UPI00249272F7|nr:HAMP domain-containing sensor histidine kinase [Paenibacillus sp. YYML68]
MSIRMRLTLWYTGILTATLLVLAIGFYFFMNYIMYSSLKSELKSEAEYVLPRIRALPTVSSQGFSFNFELEGRNSIRSGKLQLQVVNLQDGRKFRSNDLIEADLELPGVSPAKVACVLRGSCAFQKVKVDGNDFLIHYTPLFASSLFGSSDEPIGMLQAAYFVGNYERVFVILRLVLTITMLLIIVLAASVGWFLARKALRPIERLVEATNRIEKGTDLQRRIEYDGPPDEIGVLTDTINGMLSRLQHTYTELEEAYSAQRRFVSDASHELRTPLTTIRGNVELLEKVWNQTLQRSSAPDSGMSSVELSLEAMRDISGEAERMSRLVNDLLALARADAGFQMAKAELELRPLLEDAARKAHMLPRTVEWIVGDLSAAAGVRIIGNRDYMQQLLFIFIENAFKYTEHGYVKLDALRHGGQIGIRIEDSGIGMDEQEVPHIFDRFYRADVSRGMKSGTGLGLSIARWIIDEHGGSIEVNTAKDEGSTFTLWFPIVESRVLEADAEHASHSLTEGDRV